MKLTTIAFNKDFSSTISPEIDIKSNSTLNQDHNKTDFKVPSENRKLNDKRLGSSLAVYKLLVKTTIGVFPVDVQHSISTTIANVELLYRDSHAVFPDLMKLSAVWLKSSYLSGDWSKRSFPDPVWSTRTSAPYFLSSIVTFLRDTPHDERHNEVFRFTLSLLNVYKVLTYPKPTTHDTITDIGADPYNLGDISNIEITEVLNRLGLIDYDFRQRLLETVMYSKWHFTNASGPNGNALWSAHLDAFALERDPRVKANLENFCNEFDMKYILNALRDSCVTERLIDDFPQLDVRHSKIHYIYEKGTKVRKIAIMDYFSQEALNHFHNLFAEVLKDKFSETDFTFDQIKGFQKMKSASKLESAELYSYDLTAATDRLPILFQEQIIDVLLGQGSGKLWSNLIVDRDFVTPEGNLVRYAVGQPMGAKSSFPMLALTHNIIVQIAAKRAGYSQFTDYAILGDDIVINSSLVAKEYTILMDTLKVKINKSKSVIFHHPNVRGLEFASKLAVNGVNVSPFPMKLFARVFENHELTPQLQNEILSIYDDKVPADFLWRFFGSFVNKQTYAEMIKLNSLNEELSGLSKCVDFPKDSAIKFKNIAKPLNINERDLDNFFNYVVLLDQFKRVDALLKDSATTLYSIIKWMKTENVRPLGIVRSNRTLEDYISELLLVMDPKKFHPIQEVARYEANRLIDILSRFIIVDVNLISELRKGLIQSIRTRLDQESLLLGHLRDKETYKIMSRRLLDKSLRKLIETAHFNKTKTIEQVIHLSSLNQSWRLSVEIGGKLTISPLGQFKSIGNKINLIDDFDGDESLMDMLYSGDASSKATFGVRDKYHPGDRDSSSILDFDSSKSTRLVSGIEGSQWGKKLD